MPSIIAEQYFYGVILVIAGEIDIRGDIAFLQPRIQDPKVVPNHLCLEFLIIIGISEAVGDVLEFWGSEGAEVAELIEELTADFKISSDDIMQIAV